MFADYKEATDMLNRVWKVISKPHAEIASQKRYSQNKGENYHESNHFQHPQMLDPVK